MKNAIVERPILFSGPMVRAILEGRKTQTRRIVKPQPPSFIDNLHGNELRKRAPYEIQDADGNNCGWGFQDEENNYKFPYGTIGERLWVRETWQHTGPELSDEPGYVYRADDPDWKSLQGWVWKPSIFMPREACRIVLEIENIRVERLQEITNADCLAEGIQPLGPERVTERTSSGFEELPVPIHIQAGKFDNRYSTVRGLFAGIWQQIHGVESWIANPWVWVIQFRKIEDR
jgi:hypothetical protein